jgi:2-methoxy-6-polyprenyl-1,4-benzoquinol methylase
MICFLLNNLVSSVFSNVADSYDKMNDVMSAGIHRCWKNRFVEVLGPGPESKILDVAGGTGSLPTL